MKITVVLAAAACCALSAAQACAQDRSNAAAVAAPPDQPSASAPITAAVGTVIGLEITQALSSKTSKTGDRFPFRLIQPLSIGETVVIPAGTVGEGEVIHSAAASMGGKPGELVMSARFLLIDGRQTPLRGLQVFRTGRDNTNNAMATSIGLSMAIPAGGLLGMLVKGGDLVVPVGTAATAKLAAAVQAPPPAMATNPSSENGAP